MLTNRQKLLVSIVGPTAVGKTDVAIELALFLNTEILSADSRQIFYELNIGTATPTEEQLRMVPHHLINTHSVAEPFDAGRYEQEALKVLDGIFSKRDVAVLVGGSGLYVDAIWQGFDSMPAVPSQVRNQLRLEMQQNGLTHLAQELAQKDRSYYDLADTNNPQRVIRALEVIRSTGKPFSDFLKGKRSRRNFEPVKIGLVLEKEELDRRISRRVDEMIQSGLIDEAKELQPFGHLNALQTVGYREIFRFFNGAYDQAKAIELVKRNTRRYAKRQLTWFKRDPEIRWFDPADRVKIKEHVLTVLEPGRKDHA